MIRSIQACTADKKMTVQSSKSKVWYDQSKHEQHYYSNGDEKRIVVYQIWILENELSSYFKVRQLLFVTTTKNIFHTKWNNHWYGGILKGCAFYD